MFTVAELADKWMKACRGLLISRRRFRKTCMLQFIDIPVENALLWNAEQKTPKTKPSMPRSVVRQHGNARFRSLPSKPAEVNVLFTTAVDVLSPHGVHQKTQRSQQVR
jgi:hypothetical protein